MRELFLVIIFSINFGYAQVFSFISQDEGGTLITHRILMDSEYYQC